MSSLPNVDPKLPPNFYLVQLNLRTHARSGDPLRFAGRKSELFEDAIAFGAKIAKNGVKTVAKTGAMRGLEQVASQRPRATTTTAPK